MKTENKNSKDLINLVSFIMLIIIAVLTLVDKLLPVIGVNVDGLLFAILELIREIFVFILVAFFAYKFVAKKTDSYKITYWVAFGVYLAGIILMLF